MCITLLSLLDNTAPTLCHDFGCGGECRNMDAAVLSDALERALDNGWEVVYVLSAAEPLKAGVKGAIEPSPGRVVLPLLTPAQQERLGVPFALTQTVVAVSLVDLVERAAYVQHRPVILHVLPSELPHLAQRIESMLTALSQLTIQLGGLGTLRSSDLKLYESQLAQLGTYMLRAASGGGMFCVSNMLPSSFKRGCPASCGLYTLGPDGHVYLCPSHARLQEQPLGSLEAALNIRAPWQEAGHSGCPLVERLRPDLSKQISAIAAAEQKAYRAMCRQAAERPYLFEGLKRLFVRCAIRASLLESPLCRSGCVCRDDLTVSDLQQAWRRLCVPAEADVLPQGTSTVERRAVFERRVCQIQALLRRWTCGESVEALPPTAPANRLLQVWRGWRYALTAQMGPPVPPEIRNYVEARLTKLNPCVVAEKPEGLQEPYVLPIGPLDTEVLRRLDELRALQLGQLRRALDDCLNAKKLAEADLDALAQELGHTDGLLAEALRSLVVEYGGPSGRDWSVDWMHNMLTVT